jgi:glucosamine-6-phosphate deaminase
MPFYESGEIVKKPLGEEDLTIIENLINKIKPDYIYAAGDLTDPHGTHRVCLQAIMKVLDRLDEKEKFLSKC